MTTVNLGCGNRFLPGWINFDFYSNHSNVQACDLRKGIPLDTNSADFVYHSHVLEHFTKIDGAFFIKECFRVLRPGGILRIAVPDLETLAKEYIARLENVKTASLPMHKKAYDWALVELIDQMVREQSGGEMLKIWQQEVIANEDQIANRLGHEFLAWRRTYLQNKSVIQPVNTNGTEKKSISLTDKLKQKWKLYWLNKWGIDPGNLPLSAFAQSGEKHKWMYDFYSLKELLLNVGFSEVHQADAYTSKFSSWHDSKELDLEDGKVRKPDSLFIEAIK